MSSDHKPAKQAASEPPQRRLILGPFNRVEGDLEVQLDIAQGQVRQAKVHSTMYRGFESMLVGRHAMDAVVIVPRICGICSVSQSVASARALASAAGLEPPPGGKTLTNIMLAVENIADHLTHFYLFFMPDFCRTVYCEQPWFAEASRRFGAGQGAHTRLALNARQRWFTILGTLGGKWPHSHSIQPGGFSRDIDLSEKMRLIGKLNEFCDFIQDQIFGGSSLEDVAALRDKTQLENWMEGAGANGDLAFFLRLARRIDLHLLGKSLGRYLSYGAYPQANQDNSLKGDALHFAPGVWDSASQTCIQLNTQDISEDASHAWYADDEPSRHPKDGSTLVQVDKPQAYTWNKAPRWRGKVVETGALARQLVAGNALMRALEQEQQGNVTLRILARWIEVANLLLAMREWLSGFVCKGVLYNPLKWPAEHSTGEGLTEAARGALGHWLALDRHGKISQYQIIAPTSWNFSPRDRLGVPGALEIALMGTPIGAGKNDSVEVQHIVRSFDPCMVCTVH